MKKLITFLIIAAALVSCSKTELKPQPTRPQIVAAKDSVSLVTIQTDTITLHDARLNVDVFMQIRDSAGMVMITAYCNTKGFAPCDIFTNLIDHSDKMSFSPAGTVNRYKFLEGETSVTDVKLN